MSNHRSFSESEDSFLRTDLVTVGAGLVGKGLFASTAIPRGTVIGCLTPGTPVALPIDSCGVVDYGFWESAQTIDLVIEPDRLICLVKDFGAAGPRGADLINHSCTPNCEIEARLLVRACRDIAPGEELLTDYLADKITLHKEGIPCLCRPDCPTII